MVGLALESSAMSSREIFGREEIVTSFCPVSVFPFRNNGGRRGCGGGRLGGRLRAGRRGDSRTVGIRDDARADPVAERVGDVSGRDIELGGEPSGIDRDARMAQHNQQNF